MNLLEIKSMGIVSDLHEHIDLYPTDSTMGMLLRSSERLIASQGKLIAEANILVNNYIDQERYLLARLEAQGLEIDNLKLKAKRDKIKLSKVKKTIKAKK
tara:strand:- start:211 stop:510 length:300 start_codon:yes stop_codon:yes gene_type:complete